MPFATVKLRPGINVEFTPVLNEAGYSESGFGRFKAGLFQKIGGWTKYYGFQISGVARALHPWQDLNVTKYLGIGSTTALNVLSAGNLNTITPQTKTTNFSPNFSTTNGSATVTVTDSGIANVTTDDYIYFNTPVSVGGLILSGFYPIQTITGTTSYTITTASTATSTVSNTGSVPAFAAQSTSSSLINVTLNDHGLVAGSEITFPIATTAYGVTIQGTYSVVSVTSANVFVIAANALPSSTSSFSMNSGNAQLVYYIELGPQAAGSGYGLLGYGGTNTATVTITIATPGVVTWTAHGFATGQAVVFTTTGALPTGITAGTTYYVSSAGLATDTFQLATTLANAVAGSPVVNTSGSQSGTQTGSAAVGGYGTGYAPTSQTGTAITTTNWSLDNFGELLVACPKDGAIYYYDTNGGYTTAQVMPNAPVFNRGIFVAMPEQQIVAYGSSLTPAGGIGIQQDPLLVRWCDVGDFTQWTAAATNQAGSYRIPTGSEIIGAIQSAQNGLLWTDLDLWAMSYIGQPLIYAFNKIGPNCGLIGNHARTQLLGVTYWMGRSNFFMLSGQGVTPIPCSVWDYVFQDLDTANQYKCVAAADTAFNEVFFFFPSASGGTGEIDKYVKFNTEEKTWDYGVLGRTAWTDQSVLGQPIGAGSDGYIYQHETTNDADGTAIGAYLQSGYWMLAEGEAIAFVDWILPDFKWGLYGTSPNAQIQITIYATMYPGDTPQILGPYTVTQATQYINTRIRARYMAVRMSSSDLGSWWRIGGLKYRFAVDGRR